MGRTGSASLGGTEVSVGEIRSAAAAAAASSAGYYPPSLHGALVGSPEPDPTGERSWCFLILFSMIMVGLDFYVICF